MVLLEYIISNKQWNEIFLAPRQMENLKKKLVSAPLKSFFFGRVLVKKSDEFLSQSFKDMLSVCLELGAGFYELVGLEILVLMGFWFTL